MAAQDNSLKSGEQEPKVVPPGQGRTSLLTDTPTNELIQKLEKEILRLTNNDPSVQRAVRNARAQGFDGYQASWARAYAVNSRNLWDGFIINHPSLATEHLSYGPIAAAFTRRERRLQAAQQQKQTPPQTPVSTLPDSTSRVPPLTNQPRQPSLTLQEWQQRLTPKNATSLPSQPSQNPVPSQTGSTPPNKEVLAKKPQRPPVSKKMMATAVGIAAASEVLSTLKGGLQAGKQQATSPLNSLTGKLNFLQPAYQRWDELSRLYPELASLQNIEELRTWIHDHPGTIHPITHQLLTEQTAPDEWLDFEAYKEYHDIKKASLNSPTPTAKPPQTPHESDSSHGHISFHASPFHPVPLSFGGFSSPLNESEQDTSEIDHADMTEEGEEPDYESDTQESDEEYGEDPSSENTNDTSSSPQPRQSSRSSLRSLGSKGRQLAKLGRLGSGAASGVSGAASALGSAGSAAGGAVSGVGGIAGGGWVVILILLLLLIIIGFIMILTGQSDKAGNVVTLQKTAPERVDNGQDITYTFNVSYGGSPSQIVVEDTLPENTTYVSSTGPGVKTYDRDSNETSDPELIRKVMWTMPLSGGGSGGSTVIPPMGENLPPNKDTCGGKYSNITDGGQHNGDNFGDPACTLANSLRVPYEFTDPRTGRKYQWENVPQGLLDLLTQLDPQNVGYWIGIAACEAPGFDPNNASVATNGTAFGLFQMGASMVNGREVPYQNSNGLNGQYDRGDVNWQNQVYNAIYDNKERVIPAGNPPFRYYECAKIVFGLW